MTTKTAPEIIVNDFDKELFSVIVHIYLDDEQKSVRITKDLVEIWASASGKLIQCSGDEDWPEMDFEDFWEDEFILADCPALMAYVMRYYPEIIFN